MSNPAPDAPRIARLKPCLVPVEAGRTYFWCSCGRSQQQPFCDGSHAGTGHTPRKFRAERTEEVLLCACKQTRGAPYCDGAHNNLPGGSPVDDPDSAQNRLVPLSEDVRGARTLLNGNCYVFTPGRAQWQQHGPLRYCTVISSAMGSQYQTQLLMRLEPRVDTPWLCLDDSHTILFVSRGRGRIDIGGRRFDIKSEDGIYVRPRERFQLTAIDGELEVFASASPNGELRVAPAGIVGFGEGFDARFGQRLVPVDREQRTAMGARYFQVLVDKRIGSDVLTQFIGHIPPSKAAPHRHLYEETLIILSGKGCMWTEDRKALVRAGDAIFLPRKQVHSLQSTSPEGMDVIGVIYPGDNPSINY